MHVYIPWDNLSPSHKSHSLRVEGVAKALHTHVSCAVQCHCRNQIQSSTAEPNMNLSVSYPVTLVMGLACPIFGLFPLSPHKWPIRPSYAMRFYVIPSMYSLSLFSCVPHICICVFFIFLYYLTFCFPLSLSDPLLPNTLSYLVYLFFFLPLYHDYRLDILSLSLLLSRASSLHLVSVSTNFLAAKKRLCEM